MPSYRSKLPNQQNPLVRLNSLCPYYTMFPLDFPYRVLRNAKPEEWVLDPFCGRGTTNFAARLLGLPSVGIDSSPVASAIAAAKFVDVEAHQIVHLCKHILKNKRPPNSIPTGDFWDLCYHPDTLYNICKVREYFLNTTLVTGAELALRALMLGILHGPRNKGKPTYLSNQMPRTYATKPEPAIKYWHDNELEPVYIDVLDAVARRANYSFCKLPSKTIGEIKRLDSRQLNSTLVPNPFQWVVTSPPYYGMKSYIPDQWLRNWFLGGRDTVDYTQEGQITQTVDSFARSLSEVWQKVAEVCVPGARMIIRFGALPSAYRDPRKLLKESLALADCGWHVKTTRNAGISSSGKRQAEQFGRDTGEAVEEIDLYAMLEH